MADSRQMATEPAQDERYDLPAGWVWASLGEVIDLKYGKGLPAKSRNLSGQTPVYGSNGIVGYHDKALTSSPVIVVGRKGSVGEVHISSTRCWPIDTTYFIDNFPLGLDATFLFQYLRSQKIRDLDRSTAVPGINRGDLYRMPFPLAPFGEQRRIVTKIEALFEQSRTARQALDRIPPLLKKFRQSALAAAFRGDLTRDWREQNSDIEPASVLLEHIRTERRRKWEEEFRARGKDPRKAKYKEPAPVDHNGLENLPEGWEYTTVSEVGSLNGDPVLTGPFGAQLPSKEFVLEGVPVIAIGNVMWGNLRLEKVDHVTQEKALKLSRYTLQPGDVLFTRSGTVGRSAVVPEYAKGWLMSYHLLRARVEKSVCDPTYLYFVFRGLLTIQDQITETARGATRPGFNTLLLKQLRLPLPPMDEQQRIVTRIEELFGRADAIAAVVEAARQRADKLDQSILARAFRGELAPQDPNDEPASSLLERIRAERTKGGITKGRRPSRQRDGQNVI